MTSDEFWEVEKEVKRLLWERQIVTVPSLPLMIRPNRFNRDNDHYWMAYPRRLPTVIALRQ